MDCFLRICAGESSFLEATNPSPEEIERAIDELIPVKYHFVVLEYDELIENCAYVQTLITGDDTPDIRYQIETRFIYENNFQHYQKFTTDVDEIKKVFRMFALEVMPNIEGWTDITANFPVKDSKEKSNA